MCVFYLEEMIGLRTVGREAVDMVAVIRQFAERLCRRTNGLSHNRATFCFSTNIHFFDLNAFLCNHISGIGPADLDIRIVNGRIYFCVGKGVRIHSKKSDGAC